jgi:phage terminase Nu1 subunit (DNA packaging protein)
LSRNDLATLLGTNPGTISKWEAEGLPVAVKGGQGTPSKFRMPDVWRWGLDRERARASGSTDPAMNLPVERAKLSRIQTQLAQQKFRKAEGELLEAHEIGRTWSLIVLAIKSKLLALATTVADRIVGAVRGADTEEEARAAVVAIVAAEVRDTLRELAGWKVEEPKQEEAVAG